MPQPRHPRPKHLARGSLSSRRRAHTNDWLIAKIAERFEALAAQLEQRRHCTYRGAYGVISYFLPGQPIPPGYQKVEYDQDGNEIDPPAKEKAPDLAAEGFNLSVIPAEEPGPPTKRLGTL